MGVYGKVRECERSRDMAFVRWGVGLKMKVGKYTSRNQ